MKRMKRLPQHSQYFLRSPQLVAELIGHSSIKRSDLVYDIGAGSGVISSVLARRAGLVVAVEFEPRTATILRANMEQFGNVTVVEGDFLELPLPDTPYKVFANIPFHLSSPIVRRLTSAKNPPKATYLIVQKQFAQKLRIDTDQFTGMLGAMIAPWFSVRIRKRLVRTDFWPHPAVDTAFVEIALRDEPLLPRSELKPYQDFVARCYDEAKFFAKTPRGSVVIPTELRPSQVRLSQWLALYHAAQQK